MPEATDTELARTGTDFFKLLRLRSMLQSLHEEARLIDADASSLERLASIHVRIESQLASAIPADLGAELAEFSSCCEQGATPSKPEIRVAQAQLIGWIEGLMQGVQLSMQAAGDIDETEESDPVVDVSGYNPNSYL